MAKEDLINTIMAERIEIGLKIIEDICESTKKKLSDFEKMDLAVRCGNALFIEKNKSFRVGQMRKREEEQEKQ